MSYNAAAADEILALEAIFGTDFVRVDPGTFRLTILLESSSVVLEFSLPQDYPTHSPPVWLLLAGWLTESISSEVSSELLDLWEKRRDVIIFSWAEWLRENLGKFFPASTAQAPIPQETDITSLPLSSSKSMKIPNIVHGQPLTDRKSKFQAHLAWVSSIREVRTVMETLNTDKKISNATHNICAYRIQDGSGLVENRDDDGEKGAGDKLLFMLQMQDVRNVCVVVSRWFGGILLGGDRFRHIVNVAKELLDAELKVRPSEASLSSSAASATSKKSFEKVLSKIKWAGESDLYVVGFASQEQQLSELPLLQRETLPFPAIKYIKKKGTSEILWQC